MSTVTQEALSPETASFLSQGPLKGFIGGKDVESSNGETFITHDPAVEKPLQRCFICSPMM